MRNTYKFTKLYSGGEPQFTEGDVFRTVIPLSEIATMKSGPGEQVSDEKVSIGENGTQNGTQSGTRNYIIDLINEDSKITRKAMAEKMNISTRTLQRMLNAMPEIIYVGRGKNGHWEIKNTLQR